jgi:DNA-binding response OmpR family regulator
MSGRIKADEILSRRILAIDDEETNLLLLSNLLEREGYQNVRCVDDPTTALSTFADYAPDLILLDLMMPDVDGFQLLEALKRYDRADDFLPVLVLTADTTLQARRRALSLGASDFVSKPFDLVEVGLRISNLLETRILYERLKDKVSPAPKGSSV